ncbi:DUF72 domain-containing protein [Paenibacillus thiaminolyticus]|uniref:DUF72 domain-containing protein n=1 Tax=Paenibacillus thiaminolyticus TaxID=49283 RepID=UPI002543F32B|nr:DUF72 domain-containing protein [Paenibacillus thiaminolyticus]WII39720.1 DUF72 domain-containing protein [Paenibacillus thiaminolyticus]
MPDMTEQPVSERIQIGLAGWGDHDIYPPGTKGTEKLAEYAKRFPVVEMDSSFYAIPSPERMESWAAQTPDGFRFVVKAYQGMTGHTRGRIPYDNAQAMFQACREAVEVLHAAGKLHSVMFQYPPWFHCVRRHVDILRRTRQWMGSLPVTLEFRHQSWFTPEMRERTLAFMREEGWIHSVCDEPQAGEGSIPIVPVPTDKGHTLIRLHGRNTSGWQSQGQANWRDVRYLYRYNEQELLEWKERLLAMLAETEQCCVIFNNNSGGDAAPNALQLMRLLDMVPPSIGPEWEQMSLFGDTP